MAGPPHEKKSEPAPAERRILPMQLQIGARLGDETGDWEVIGRPYTTAGGKDAGRADPLNADAGCVFVIDGAFAASS